jgi:hypothetical protein
MQKFDEKTVLNQLGIDVSKDDYEESIKKLNKLCIHEPFKTQLFVQAFERAWCIKILDLLNKNYIDEAGIRIRLIYMNIKYNKIFNQLIKRYFEKINHEKILGFLENRDKAIHLAMQSQYFYQENQYSEANKSVKNCFDEIKIFFNKNFGDSEAWLLIQKSLKNINDKKISEDLLNQILINVDK